MKTPLQEFYEYMEQHQYFIGNDLFAKYKDLLAKQKAADFCEDAECNCETSKCAASADFFERWMLDYVKETSTANLFFNLTNVTKPKYQPIVDEILKRYNQEAKS